MSQVNSRLVYRTAYKALVKAGVDPRQAILSQSYLRLEVTANASRTNYQFGVLVNDQPQGAAPRVTENRLALQDSFFCSSVSFFTAVTANATDTNFSLDTYPNPRKYSTAGASQALYNMYNGYLNLTVNNRVITGSWDMYRHLEINQTQQTVTPVATTIPLDQINGNSSTAVACEPNWVLIGSKNNNLSITLPQAVGTLQASSTTVFVLILRGVLAQNSTSVS